MGRFTYVVLALIAMATTANAHTFMPRNNLHLQDHQFRSNIQEGEFNQVIDKADAVYKPIFQKFGANLQIVRKWSDSTVNAYAEQFGTTWRVTMFGGLARRPEVTADGFATVLCHEIGHHLAGFPFTQNGQWAANEGQSDYFATQECVKKLWPKDGYNPVPPHQAITQRCDAAWSADLDRKACYRAGMAGKSLAELLAASGGSVDVTKKDTNVVSTTNSMHPAPQCRFDTYMAGALCKTPFNDSVIPGKSGSGGDNSTQAETTAYKYSCGEGEGSRPRCWYAPKVTPAPNPNPNPNPNPDPKPTPDTETFDCVSQCKKRK